MTARDRAARAGVLAVPAAVLLAGCGGSTPARAPAPAATSAASAPAAPGSPATTLLVTDFGADTVTFVDPSRTGRAADLGSVRVGTAPYGLVVVPDGIAWVATAEGVAVVDTRTRALATRIPYTTRTGRVGTGEYRGGGMGIALSPDGPRIHVGVNVPGDDGALEVVDSATRAVTRVVPVGRRPFDVDVSATGPIDSDVDAGPSLTIRAPDGAEHVVPLDGPHESVTLSPDGRTAYVFGGFTRDGGWNGLTLVDTTTGTTTRLPVGRLPLAIAVLP
ncbi:YncE family protein [Embleya sp. NPDC055664]